MRAWLPLFGALLSHCQVNEVSDSTCAELDWPVKNGTQICGSSKNAGQCSLPSNESVATHFCHSQGARLCRIDEIRRGAVAGTGCNVDWRRIWSSTSCGDSRRFTMAGGGVDCTNSLLPEACVDIAASSDGVNDVYTRCCADEPEPQPAALSALPCKELGWSIQNTSCTKGALGDHNQCLPDMSYYQAWQTCDNLQARLCTEQEIKQGILIGAECDLEHALVWTSTFCPGTNFVKSMGGSLWQLTASPEACSQRKELRRAACCADAITAAPTSKPARFSSKQPTQSPSTHSSSSSSPTITQRSTGKLNNNNGKKPSSSASSSPTASRSLALVSVQNRGLALPTITSPPSVRTVPSTFFTSPATSLIPTANGKRLITKVPTSSFISPSTTLPPSLSVIPLAQTGGGKKGKLFTESSTTSTPTPSLLVVLPSKQGGKGKSAPAALTTTVVTNPPTSSLTPAPTTPVAIVPLPTPTTGKAGKGGKVHTVTPTPLTSPTSPSTLSTQPVRGPTSVQIPTPSPNVLPISQNAVPSSKSALPSSVPSAATTTTSTTTPLAPSASPLSPTPRTSPVRSPDNQTVESRVAFDLNYITTFLTSNTIDFRPPLMNTTNSTFSPTASVSPPQFNFTSLFRSEFARAVGISPSRIAVVKLSPGSIVTDFEILPAPKGSSEPTAQQADTNMRALVMNTSSPLYGPDFLLFSKALPSSYESRNVQESNPGPTDTPRGIVAPTPQDHSNHLLYLLFLLLLLPLCCALCLCCWPGKRRCWACHSCRKRCCRTEKVPVEFDAGPSKPRAAGPELLHIRKPTGSTPKGENERLVENSPLMARHSHTDRPRFDSNAEYYDTNLGPDQPGVDGMQSRSAPHLQGDAFDTYASPRQQAYQQQLLQQQQNPPALPVFHGGFGPSSSHHLQTPHSQPGGSSPNFSSAKTPRQNTLFPPLAGSSSSSSASSSSPRTPRGGGGGVFSSCSSSAPSSPPIFSPKKTPRSPGSMMIKEDTRPQVEYFTGEGETDPSLAISLFVFPGKDPEDLPLEQGQKIKVLTRTPANYEGDDWWSGELEDGQQGVFPRIWVLAIGDAVETCGLPNPALNDQLGKIVAIEFERQEVLVKIPHHGVQFFPTSNLKLVTEGNADE